MDDQCCYVCNECPNSYTTLDELETHMDAAHAGVNTSGDNNSNNSTSSNDKDNRNGTSPSLPEALLTQQLQQKQQQSDDEKQSLPDESKDDNMDHDGNEPESGGNSPSSSDVSNFDGGIDGGGAYGLDESMNGEEGKGFGCRFCPKIFEERSQLNVHYTHTHRDKPQYECEECHTVFAVKRELSTHMRIHSGEQPHSCTQCGKEFGTRQLLKKHWMWHTGERSHVCPHCGKAFFQKGHLTQHLMIHAGGRPHQCHLCQKTFIFKFDLNRHMKIHAERGFSCDKCGRSFIKQLQLDEHSLKCKGSSGNRSHSTTRTSTPLNETPKSLESSSSSQQSPSRRQPSNQQIQAVNFSPEDMNKVAQLLVAQQQQRALAAAAAVQAQQNVSSAATSNSLLHMSNAIQSANNTATATTPNNHSNNPNGNSNNNNNIFYNAATQQQNNFLCIFCMKHFNTQASFTLHLSFVHFRNGILNPNPQTTPTSTGAAGSNAQNTANALNEMKFNPALMSASIFAPPVSLNTGIQDEVLNLAHSDSATSSSSCASSPQKASPVFTNGNANGLTAGHSPTRLSDSSDHLSGGTESPDTTIHPQKVCENCEVHRHRIHELERCLAAKQIELKNTRELMRRISAIAGSLLESCSDFDKQWISHSRKVYSQIQSVICNME